MTTSLIGARVPRKEDYRFLTGAGQYTDDVALAGQTYAAFVRSPHAHANIRRVSTDKAKRAPGVIAVYTGADLAAAKVGGLPCGWLITDVKGQPMKEPPYPVLAQGKVRHVGERVAVVVAESAAQARDAGELVEVDYQPLPAVASAAKARSSGAIHEIAPDNVCYVWALGDKNAVDAAFAKAAHVTKLEFVNNRLIPNAIEPRAVNAVYSRADDSTTLYVASQNPHVERLLMTAFVLGLPENKVRVVAPDVGGGFGSKIYLYAEDVACTWAARQLARPVKWTADRSEAFLSDAHGRDHLTVAELALASDGKFLAMRVHTTAAMGAYLSTFASCIPTILYATLLAGQYTTPAIYCEVTAVFTNTAPVDAYRGAGRPEATYVVERLVYAAAAEMGIAQDEIRRRNFIRKFPYQTPGAFPSVWAPTAHVRWRSAAPRSSRRWTKSSPKARRSPRTCSRRRKPTSSSRTASSTSPAPTAARPSAKSRWLHTCRTTIRSTSWSPASTRPHSTIRPISRSLQVRTSVRSRSIPRPASCRLSTFPLATTSATSSIR